jgi:Tol biopolymer transport system component
MDLDEAKVLYRSTLKEGYLQHFFLTPSGRHLVWDGNSEEGGRVCWLIDLDTGTQTSCALGSSYQLSFVTGISADGTRVSYDTFTSDFKRILAIWEGGQVTELAPPEDGWTLCSACGGLSPDGQTVYALRFGSGGTFPPVKIWKQPVGGEAAEVASLPEGVSIQIQDNFFRMSEDGARAIFDCRSEQFPKTKQGACAVDLTTGALTLYPDLLSPSLQLDGKQLAGYLGFGALEGQLFSFGSAAPVATFPSRGVWPTLSPDGSRLAYKAIFNGDGGYAPSTMAVDGSDVVRVQGSGDSGNQGPMVWAR